jgi:hypothetical protein
VNKYFQTGNRVIDQIHLFFREQAIALIKQCANMGMNGHNPPTPQPGATGQRHSYVEYVLAPIEDFLQSCTVQADVQQE